MLLLPLLLSFLTAIAIFWLSSKQERSLRDSFLKSSLLHGVLIVFLTEALSSNSSLKVDSVSLAWAIILLINILLLVVVIKEKSPSVLKPKEVHWQLINSDDLICAATALIVLGITLMTAMISAPNNWDVMTYHLPRVMHWLQNQTVAHYPTNNLRQISLPPGAGYFVAQLQILSSSDRFANFTQWFAFSGSTIATSLITEKFVDIRSRWLCVLVAVSIPMAIMQATTAQTDLMLTYWLLCFTYFIFKGCSYRLTDCFFIAASLGLSILTKPTAFLFAFPLAIFFVFRVFLQNKNSGKPILKELIKKAFLIFLVFLFSLILVAPSYWRNYSLFNSWMGLEFGTRNEIFGIPQILSNILKNLAINLPIPGTWQLIDFIHQSILHVDINDLRLNYVATPLANGTSPIQSILKVLAPHEDYVGNPVHLLLIVLGWISLIFNHQFFGKNFKGRNLLILSLASLLSFLSFCLLLKWQIWGNRLLLPLFWMNVPLITHYLSHTRPQLRRVFITLLAVLAIFYALTPMRHPLVALPTGSDEQSVSILGLPRSKAYFAGAHKDLEGPYRAAIASLDQCRSVGLAIGGDDWEYPLWMLMQEQSSSKFQIKHVNTSNESDMAQPEFSNEQVCAVISTTSTYKPDWRIDQKLIWQERLVSQDPLVQVFVLKAKQA